MWKTRQSNPAGPHGEGGGAASSTATMDQTAEREQDCRSTTTETVSMDF